MKQRVLLVEDDVWLKEMYQTALGSVDLITAESAEAALELLNEQSFNLILLDMFLPEHNGVEFIHELASYEDTADVPIIILSAVAPQDFQINKEQMRHYNIVEYLYKPEVKPHEVAERVQLHLRELITG